jgi:hypothetical protein
MPQFPSPAWIDEFCSHLEAQDDIGEVAHALDGVYRFVVDPAGPVTERHVYDVEIRPDGNGGAAAARLNGAQAPGASTRDSDGDPRLTLRASYDRWRQLISGQLDIAMALMLRRLKVSGDLGAITRDVNTARPLMRALRGVDTQWPENAHD